MESDMMRILAEKPLCFHIDKSVLVTHDRLDVHFLHPRYLTLEEGLERARWELKTLREISKQIVGGATPKDYDPFARKGVIFLKTVNVQDGVLNLKDKHYISIESHERKKHSEVRMGDLLLTIIGASEEVVGRVVMVREDIVANINQNIAKIRLKDGILPEYVEAFLSTNVGRDLILRMSRTATRVNMNLKEVESIKIPLPSGDVQEEIVKIMKDAREKRDKSLVEVRRLREELADFFLRELGLDAPEEREESSFVSALDDRFDPYYYHPRFKRVIDSLRGGRFQLKRLEEVAQLSNAQIDPRKEPDRLFKYIQIQNVSEIGHKISSYTSVLGKNAPGRARMLVKEGDILLPTLGGSLESVAVVPKEFDGEVATNGFAVLRVSNHILRYYLFYYLTTRFARMQIEQQLTGAIMSSIGKSEVRNVLVPLPDVMTQEEIANRVRMANDKIEELQEVAEDIIKKGREQIEKVIGGI